MTACHLFTIISAIAFRFSFEFDEAQRVVNFYSFLGVLSIYLGSYLFVGSHKGILRHTSVDDVIKVFKATILGVLGSVVFSLGSSFLFDFRLFPVSILAFHFSITFIALVGIRLAAKSVYIAGTHKHDDQWDYFGCGDSGIMTKNALQQEQKGKFKVVAFSGLTLIDGVTASRYQNLSSFCDIE